MNSGNEINRSSVEVDHADALKYNYICSVYRITMGVLFTTKSDQLIEITE